MKRWIVLCSLLTLLSSLHAQQKPYESVVQKNFVSGGSIRLHLEAGGYTIKPSDADRIVVTYDANSNGDLGKVKVEIKSTALSADVYVRNTPHNNFRASIEVPRRSNLWARLSAGELEIEDVEGDKNIEMWAGQLDIAVPHPEAYGHRDASVLAGSLEASAFNVSKGGLFRSFREEGPGKYRLHAHVTTGEIDVRGTK
jgi:hypothetical protein